MTFPTISIITPTYNAETTLVKCIESVACQSYSSVEHIIVDGASQDNTLHILEQYKPAHTHLRFTSEKDQGIYDAMNKGIFQAKGEWIYFLGADDCLYNEHVLTDVFGNNEPLAYDVLYGDVLSSRFQGRYDGIFDGEKIIKKNICHQAIFFHKSVFNKTGNFDLRFKGHADWDHNLRWFLDKNIRRKYVPIIIADYADGGFSSINSDEKFKSVKKELALQYDKGVMPYRYKAGLAKSFAKMTAREGKLIDATKYFFLFLKTRIQLAITK